MNLYPDQTEHTIPKEIKQRLTGGLLISIAVHAFILSLQFGLPGLGMPGLEAPWAKRRAESPQINIQIANSAPAGKPDAAAPASVAASSEPPTPVKPLPPLPSTREVTPKPDPASASSAIAPLAAASDKTESKAALAGIRLIAPQKAAPVPAPAQSKPAAKPSTARKAKINTTPPAAQQRKVQAPDVARVITQDIQRDDSFAMAVPNPDDFPRKADTETDPRKQYDSVTQEGVEQETPQELEAKAREKEQKRKKREELMRKQAEDLARQVATDGKAELQQISKELNEESRKVADEANRKQAAALALQKQLEAEEQNRRAQREAAQAEEIKLAEQKSQEDSKRQEEEKQRTQQLAQAQQQAKEQQAKEQQVKEQQAKELQVALEAEKRKQEEQRQQAAVRKKQQDELLAKQKSEEQLAKQKSDDLVARQKADEQAARQRAEQVAAEQRAQAQAQAAAQAAANNQTASTGISPGQSTGQSAGQQNNAGATTPGNGTAQGNKSDPFSLPKNILGSDLANKARDQARGIDLLRGAPPVVSRDAEDKPRRRSLFGSQDKDVPLRLYIDSWKQKIERNGSLNYSQLAKDRARGDPVVVVSIRSDGSVEDISIVRSSGRADIDEAVRRIVRLNAKYAAFPPNIAAQYDVIEIRRIWNFEDNLRLVEELR
ncbi:energy transducer TonB [Undibacterium umbellatum]|uniref:TonB family protein n=1 Tax=Undibacterium umbellatum TaxID=2762300 RepID=A0ABR6Z7X0_9BURK|nr:energy transducer TonB [Undibacterium umbellatum]MBC3907435.1 TonB family protein [Undibacterium umbellatum]